MAARLLALVALLAPAGAAAHGVEVEVERRDGAVAVRARYEGGRPLAGARYEVVSPAHPERPFDAAATDRHGWVAFVPDAPGTWRVRIVDAGGHGRVAEVEVDAGELAGAFSTSTSTPTPTATSTSTSTSTGTRLPLSPRAAGGEGQGEGGAPPTPTSTPAAPRPRAARTALGLGALALAFGALYAVQRRRRDRP